MVVKGQWHNYEDGKKKEYGEFVRLARMFVYAKDSPGRLTPMTEDSQ